MIIAFFIFLGMFAVVLFIGSAKQRYGSKAKESIDSNEVLLSVIIPFRNEEANLPKLIESINKQSFSPHEILFIDDHSEDKGEQLLQKAFSGEKYVSIISLPATVKGKKNAIDIGVRTATGNYCLTLDADVEFSEDYLKSMSKYSNSDMIIAPVIMLSNSLWSHLFAFEYMLFNAFNYTFSSFYINSASGANLFFSREKYLVFNTLSRHESLASGDDHFLLRDFQQNNAKITLSNQLEHAVYSRSTDSWQEYFNQRIRWISKTKIKSNWKERSVGALLMFYLIGSYALAISLLVQEEYNLFFGVLGLRFLIDLFVYSNYTARLGTLKLFILYPVFFALYPILFVSVLIGSLIYQPKWKGRPIVKK